MRASRQSDDDRVIRVDALRARTKSPQRRQAAKYQSLARWGIADNAADSLSSPNARCFVIGKSYGRRYRDFQVQEYRAFLLALGWGGDPSLSTIAS